jgi:hypothetical protein
VLQVNPKKNALQIFYELCIFTFRISFVHKDSILHYFYPRTTNKIFMWQIRPARLSIYPNLLKDFTDTMRKSRESNSILFPYYSCSQTFTSASVVLTGIANGVKPGDLGGHRLRVPAITMTTLCSGTIASRSGVVSM